MFQPQTNDRPPLPIFVVATNDDARQNIFVEPRANANDADSTAWINDCLTECYND